MHIEETLTAALESVFGLDAHDLGDDAGPATVAAWDSVSHLNLILAIESYFGIQFSTDEIPELVSIRLIRERLEQLV